MLPINGQIQSNQLSGVPSPQAPSSARLDTLPVEILDRVASKMDTPSLARLNIASKSMQSALARPQVWQGRAEQLLTGMSSEVSRTADWSKEMMLKRSPGVLFRASVLSNSLMALHLLCVLLVEYYSSGKNDPTSPRPRAGLALQMLHRLGEILVWVELVVIPVLVRKRYDRYLHLTLAAADARASARRAVEVLRALEDTDEPECQYTNHLRDAAIQAVRGWAAVQKLSNAFPEKAPRDSYHA